MREAQDDHLPDADLRREPHGRAPSPQRTAEDLESLLAKTLRELEHERAENQRLRIRLKRHPELD